MKLSLPKTTLCLLLISAISSTAAEAQVAISLGVQQLYDDNVFLENDRRRPAPFVLNDALDEDISDGDLSVYYSEQADGDPDDDFITNVSLDMSTDLPQVEDYAEVNLSGKLGGLFFAEFSEQNRVTVDALFDARISDLIIPRPYMLSFSTELSSDSDDISVAEGTATRTTQSLTSVLRAGIQGMELSASNLFDLGYTGAYHLFLGEFLFSDNEDNRFEENGSDYHTHTASTKLTHLLSQKLRVGIDGSVGVHLVTDVQGGDTLSSLPDEDEDISDRTIGAVNLFTQYDASEKLKLGASAGVFHTSFHNDQGIRQRTVIGEDGMPTTIEFQRDDNETSLTFSGTADYIFEPGTLLGFAVRQEVGTDIDGDSISVRSVSLNGVKGFGDRVKLDGGLTFVQFSETDNVSNPSDRIEFSTSASYQLTQFSAIVLGYNFVDQSADEDELERNLRFRAQDYTANRIFLSVNVGLVGLPL